MKKNLLVAQSGGPTAVINASLCGVIREGMRHPEEIGMVYGAVNGIQGILEGTIIRVDDQFETAADFELLCHTPSSALGSCRYKMPSPDKGPEQYAKILAMFRKYNIGYFAYIGGNDSMDTANKIADYCYEHGEEVRVVGVPKTIDNDLPITDHCPGFGSAAKYIATTLMEVAADAEVYPMKSVVIAEIMGRNAGWLTGAAALSRGEDCDGPDLIYLPELTFDIEKFTAKVRKLLVKKDVVVVAVSEGIRIQDGRYVSELGSASDYVDAFGHKQLTGTASYLANVIHRDIGCKTRAVEFSTLQRSAAHLASRVDVNEAFMVGGAAVKAGDEGDSGKMVVIDRVSDDPYQCATGIYDVHKIANGEKMVPREWITKDGTYVTEEFIDYVRPLIQGDSPSVMVDGIPRHLYMGKK